MPSPLYIVDVFAEAPYGGNQLAVVVADNLSDETMQKVAYEMNFSETTFLPAKPETDGGYRVRIFTPSKELAFAGHPVLGTGWVIRNYVASKAAESVRLNLRVGPVAVTFEPNEGREEVVWFRAPAVTLGPTCARERIAPALGMTQDDIDTKAPVQQVSAGNAQVIVPLRSLDALKRCRLDLDAYAPLMKEGFPPLVYLYCTETHQRENDLCARFFFDAYGVREDPATGSASVYLGNYLLEHNLYGSDLSLRIEQGYEIRRPSLVRLRARIADGTREVHVGGSVIPIVQGELL